MADIRTDGNRVLHTEKPSVSDPILNMAKKPELDKEHLSMEQIARVEEIALAIFQQYGHSGK
jgi:hypothetical protein